MRKFDKILIVRRKIIITFRTQVLATPKAREKVPPFTILNGYVPWVLWWHALFDSEFALPSHWSTTKLILFVVLTYVLDLAIDRRFGFLKSTKEQSEKVQQMGLSSFRHSDCPPCFHTGCTVDRERLSERTKGYAHSEWAALWLSTSDGGGTSGGGRIESWA